MKFEQPARRPNHDQVRTDHRIGATLIGHEPEATAGSSLLVYTMPRAERPAAKARLSERLVKP